MNSDSVTIQHHLRQCKTDKQQSSFRAKLIVIFIATKFPHLSFQLILKYKKCDLRKKNSTQNTIPTHTWLPSTHILFLPSPTTNSSFLIHPLPSPTSLPQTLLSFHFVSHFHLKHFYFLPHFCVTITKLHIGLLMSLVNIEIKVWILF